MSKELTKKYYKGNLSSGYYYFSNGYEVYPVRHCCVKGIRPFADNNVSVICKMPTHDQFVELTEKADQFSQLVKKVEQLEKQLKEARDLLKGLYDDSPCQFDHNGYCQEHGSTDGNYICVQGELKEYLEKYGVKNE